MCFESYCHEALTEQCNATLKQYPETLLEQFDDPSEEEAKAHEPMCKLLEIARDLRVKEPG
jgi:hypothetical protein